MVGHVSASERQKQRDGERVIIERSRPLRVQRGLGKGINVVVNV